MAKKKKSCCIISYFTSTEAKLNQFILEILEHSPLNIYDIHKKVKDERESEHVRYSTVNRRVKSLQQSGLLKVKEKRKNKQGTEFPIYQLTPKAKIFKLLNTLDVEDLIDALDQNVALEISVRLEEAAHQIRPGK